ncbi:MAG: hypothetical protein LUD77_02390 [Clostridiales bacterium]|nr:hypothetical protein [Clostridiales bacterium]
MNGYQSLANAIVEKAAEDYIKALKALKKNPDYFIAQQMKNDYERFFKSQWIQVLTSVNSIWLMDKLRKAVGYHDC